MASPNTSKIPLPVLPVSQLESLKFKATQLAESIVSLQRILEAGGQPVVPPWPDILAKYNVLLSQTHSFSNSLLAPLTQQFSLGGSRQPDDSSTSPYERIALHPNSALTDAELDNNVVPLLRNQQTTEVLELENATVARLARHMTTRGSLGVLNIPSSVTPGPPIKSNLKSERKPEYADVLRECEEIKEAHDARTLRAVRAVAMLRDKFDWKQRVEVEVEEPEELEWDPRQTIHDGMVVNGDMVIGGDGEHGVDEDGRMDSSPEAGQSSDEDEVAGELVGQGDTPNAERGVI